MTIVCENNIKRNTFCGTTLFGDNYNLGTIPVVKVTFLVPTNKGIRQE